MAGVVPESTATRRTVQPPPVVVTFIRAEHHPVMVRKSLPCSRTFSRITRVSGYMHHVVGCLAGYNKPTVLGVVPAAIGRLQVKPELVAAARCQLMNQVVAKPEVAPRVVESDFVLRPRTVEDGGSVDFLLDQQRNAVGRYTTDNVRSS